MSLNAELVELMKLKDRYTTGELNESDFLSQARTIKTDLPEDVSCAGELTEFIYAMLDGYFYNLDTEE